MPFMDLSIRQILTNVQTALSRSDDPIQESLTDIGASLKTIATSIEPVDLSPLAADVRALLAGQTALAQQIAKLAASGSVGTTPPVTAPASDVLPPLDLTGMAIDVWSTAWTAREAASNFGVLPFKFDHVTPVGTDAVLTMDANGCGHLQAQDATPIFSDGLWETSVTLPTMRAGVDTAPHFLFADTNADEVEFEFFARLGLFVTMHSGGKATKSVKVGEAADFDGKKTKFGIKLDQTAGYCAMLVNDAEVYRFLKGQTFADDGVTPIWTTAPMKEHFDMEPGGSDQVSWLGEWAGFTSPTDNMQMIVHGYAHSALTA